MARVGSSSTPDASNSTTASVPWLDRDEKMRAACRRFDEAKQPARLAVRRSGSHPHGGRDRARRSENATRAVPACSLSSKSAAISAPQTRKREIGERRRPHRRRTRSAAELGHHHQNLAKAALAEIAPSEATPCPTSLRPDRRNFLRRAPTCFAAASAFQCSPRNPRRESRSISLISSLGSSVAIHGRSYA